MRRLAYTGLALLAASLGSCSDNKAYEIAMCALADVSGTYADEKPNIVKITKSRIITKMLPGDSLFFIRIDSNSYNEDDLIASLTLDYIPSKANQQKLAMAKKMDEFASSPTRSKFTDVSGAMMLCTDYLNATESGNKVIFVFSDMKEELKPGTVRDFADDEFKGINVAAMNVIKLDADSADPTQYRERLDKWEKRVKKAGALSWEVFNDSVHIPEFLEKLR